MKTQEQVEKRIQDINDYIAEGKQEEWLKDTDATFQLLEYEKTILNWILEIDA